MSNEMAQAIIDSTEAACAMLTSYISELRDTCAALDCNIKSDLDNAMLQFAQVQEERDELRTRLDTALAAQATPDPSAPPADLTDLQKQLSDETASKAKLAKQLRSLTLELQALKSNPGPSVSFFSVFGYLR